MSSVLNDEQDSLILNRFDEGQPQIIYFLENVLRALVSKSKYPSFVSFDSFYQKLNCENSLPEARSSAQKCNSVLRNTSRRNNVKTWNSGGNHIPSRRSKIRRAYRKS